MAHSLPRYVCTLDTKSMEIRGLLNGCVPRPNCSALVIFNSALECRTAPALQSEQCSSSALHCRCTAHLSAALLGHCSDFVIWSRVHCTPQSMNSPALYVHCSLVWVCTFDTKSMEKGIVFPWIWYRACIHVSCIHVETEPPGLKVTAVF